MPESKPNFWTRRSALGGMGGLAAAAMVTPGWAAEPVHEMAARHARDLRGDRKITLRLLMPAGSDGNLAVIAREFTQATGIDIAMITVPDAELATELSLDHLSASQEYDIALPITFSVPELVFSGVIQPLTRFMKSYEPAGFRDGVLYPLGDSFDGITYGFQTDGDAYMMFYSGDMLTDPEERARYEDRNGMALSVPLTWDELDRQMAYFHRPDQGRWGGLMLQTPENILSEWWVRLHAKGVWPFSSDMSPQIASDASIAALEDLIRARQYQHPSVATFKWQRDWKIFAEGDVYCAIGWGGAQKYLNSAASKIRGKMEFGPTPGGMVEGELLPTPYFNWGFDYVVASSTPVPELSYLFALYAASPHISTLAIREIDGYFDPFRDEHYDDARIQEVYSNKFLAVHRESLEYAIPDLYLISQGDYYSTLRKWLSRAVTGDVTPQLALQRAAAACDSITSQSDRDMQVDRWADLKSKYPANTRNKLRDLKV